VQWSGNFTGQIPFTFKTPNRKWCKPRECYLAVKLRVDQLDGAGNHTALKPISDANGNFTCYPYMSKNAVSTLFTTGKVLINDKLISNMNELSATNTLFKTIYDTRSMQETIESTNPIIPQSLTYTAPAISSITIPLYAPVITDALTTAPVITAPLSINGVTIYTNVNVSFDANTPGDVYTKPINLVMSYNNYYFNYTLPAIKCTVSAFVNHAGTVAVPAIIIPIPILSFPNRASYSQKCQLLLNNFKEQTLTWALPFSLFQANEWIPPHVKCEIDFNVNTNWHNEIISFVGASPAGGIVQLSSAVNTVASSIGVGIDDISLWLYYVTEETPINITKEIHLKQYFSQVHTIQSTNEAFTLTLPNGGRNVTHILATFLQTQRTGTIKKSSNDFSSGYSNAYPEVKITNDATTNLQMIRFILDRSYPNPDYDLNFSTGISDNCKDVSRAFYDFINNADAKFDRSGNVISIQEFINEPIFCFKVNTDTTSYNESLQVYMNMNTNYFGGTSQLLIVALYDETLRLSFDTEKVTAVELIS